MFAGKGMYARAISSPIAPSAPCVAFVSCLWIDRAVIRRAGFRRLRRVTRRLAYVLRRRLRGFAATGLRRRRRRTVVFRRLRRRGFTSKISLICFNSYLSFIPVSKKAYFPPIICRLKPSLDETNSGRLRALNLCMYFSFFPSRIAVYKTPSKSPITNPALVCGIRTFCKLCGSCPEKSLNNCRACLTSARVPRDGLRAKFFPPIILF